uniref:Uncharacterized protein n=1 Tax=Utricularia reniformis TaxID=192314 RepID=A0A1Y0B282_9LAMI|nr:hypothetical protein AEK19_MT1261 [Utricularia reniformis]ART31469.1 hypothetical protein AEK19_MT1261 [Utricularia reniformis]
MITSFPHYSQQLKCQASSSIPIASEASLQLVHSRREVPHECAQASI